MVRMNQLVQTFVRRVDAFGQDVDDRLRSYDLLREAMEDSAGKVRKIRQRLQGHVAMREAALDEVEQHFLEQSLTMGNLRVVKQGKKLLDQRIATVKREGWAGMAWDEYFDSEEHMIESIMDDAEQAGVTPIGFYREYLDIQSHGRREAHIWDQEVREEYREHRRVLGRLYRFHYRQYKQAETQLEALDIQQWELDTRRAVTVKTVTHPRRKPAQAAKPKPKAVREAHPMELEFSEAAEKAHFVFRAVRFVGNIFEIKTPTGNTTLPARGGWKSQLYRMAEQQV